LTNHLRVTSSTEVLQSFVFHVERRTVTDGVASFERDVVVHKGAVAILAVDDADRVAVLRQYRATFDDVNWELPAGTKDVEGEEPAVTATRELAEETGLVAAHVEHLFTYMNSRGWTDQTTDLFLATDLTAGDRQAVGPEESGAELHWLDRTQISDLLHRSAPLESSTLMGFQWYLARSDHGVA
jgi:ADP-ribose pyrophosphatase